MSKSSIYFHQALFRYICGFILLPTLGIIAFMFLAFYRSDIEQAKTSVQMQVSTEAADISKQLSELRYSLSVLSRDKALAEVAVNILYSQYATRSIQQFVSENPGITGVVLQDSAGYFIEGYPFETLRLNAKRLKSITQGIISQNDVKPLPELYVVSSAQLYPERTSAVGRTLIMALPLRRELPSIVTPYETTAVLYALVEMDRLLSAARQHMTEAELVSDISYDGQLLAGEIPESTTGLITSESALRLSAQSEDGEQVLTFRSFHKPDFYLSDFYTNAWQSLLLLAAFILLSLWLIRRFTQRLHTPLATVIRLSRQFANGHFSTNIGTPKYREFEELTSALSQMAKTISTQVKRLDTARKKAEASERAKTSFLANMSHEIRTPMNGVLGMLQIIKQQSLDSKLREQIGKAEMSAKNLLTIINDILDFSKIEAGKLSIEDVQFELQPMLQNIVESMSIQAQSKGLTLDMSIAPETDAYWQSDPTRISQILYNLISNAIKFTSEGGIKVNVSKGYDGENSLLQIQVSDTGIGISAEQQSKLFTAFQQADVSTTRLYGGTGLGLVISKRITELMQGSLTVESEPGKGSTFTMTVTAVALGEQHQPTQEQQSMLAPYLKGRRILIAEDNHINQDILTHFLQPTDATLKLVDNGQQVLDCITDFAPDLILMDIQMPVMDGIEATQTLRERGFSTPIVVQTANVMEEDIRHYQQIGATAHLAKPLEAEQLYLQLNQIFHQDLKRDL